MYKNGVVLSGSVNITGLERTSDLYVGEYVYSSGMFSPSTTIARIMSDDSIILSSPAIGSGNVLIEFTNITPGVYGERCGAMQDVKSVIDERGGIVEIVIRGESNVTRDNYNSIKKYTQDKKIILRAFPIIFSPTDKEVMKAGLHERSEVQITTAMLDWTNNGIDIESMDSIRTTVKINGVTYQLKDKGVAGQFSDSFLFISLGLERT